MAGVIFMTSNMVVNVSKKCLIVFLISVFLSVVFCTAAVRKNAEEGTCSTANEGQCTAGKDSGDGISKEIRTEASDLLDEATRIRKETAEVVVKNDETQRETDEDVESFVPGKNGDAFEKVMRNAAKQWVEGSGEKVLSPAARLAVEQVTKRKASQNDESKTTQITMADIEQLEESAGDSEIVLLTKALARLASRNGTDENATLSDLDLVDYLCHSGDNGKHLASIGGVELLLSFARGGTAVPAIRTLATCAQNNPPVIETAVINDDAVGVLVGLARGNTEVVAVALRALVALRTGKGVQKRLLDRQKDIVAVFQRVLKFDIGGKNERRAVLRSMALLEQILKLNGKKWERILEETGVLKLCAAAMKSEDVDVRESAAVVIKVMANASTV